MTDTPVYTLKRTFDAPSALVWRTFTEAELLGEWYGPGVETIIHKLDVRAGGVWLNEMKMGENSFYQRADYTDVTDGKELVWEHATTDADWNVIDNPMAPGWPRILLTTVTLSDANGKTDMVLTWMPLNASDAENEAFRASMEGLDRGWGSGMDILASILARLQAS